MSISSTGDRNPVEALADDFLRRQRAGERPTLDEYCRLHPELADEIREVFPVLIRMEDLRSEGPDDSTGGAAVHATTRLERLGDYRILRGVIVRDVLRPRRGEPVAIPRRSGPLTGLCAA